MALWVVRAGKYGEREEQALEKNVAAIGWDELPDLSGIKTREELYELLEKTYPDVKRKTLLNWQSQIWPFIMEMQQGDIIALPLKNRSVIVFGEVTGHYQYRSDFGPGMKHTVPVRWFKEFPRSVFDKDILYSLGAFLTVFRVQRNNAEERIRALLSGKQVDFPNEVQKAETELEAPLDLEQYANDQIRDYIARKFKGHDFARLVGAVLEAQGYRVQISAPGADGGVDIIAGYGPRGFDSPRLVVQVKSGDTPVDVKVLRELQGVMKNFRADHGLLVAWGGYKNSVAKEATQLFFEIRLWDSNDLVKALLANYEKLPEALQAELPLKPIWILVTGEEE
ncbi:MAG TPA: restriction endonuclease [Eubacteriaceae bacterium]|nr:restriction endonuclease [Eubacteriaceae bacterium]